MLDLGAAATFNAVITAEDLSAGQAITSYAVDYFGEPNPKVVSAQSRRLSGGGQRAELGRHFRSAAAEGIASRAPRRPHLTAPSREPLPPPYFLSLNDILDAVSSLDFLDPVMYPQKA